MTVAWPTVPLGNLLARSEDLVGLVPTETYREVRVRLWGKGVALRREALGGEIKADRRVRVRAGQFILSRIDARNGAFGLIPAELDGAVVSNDFPVFNIRPERVSPEFLGWLARTRQFVELCRAASEGTTNRVRLKEDRFMEARIPLPPLAEQRRIVAKIDQLAAKIAEARGLRAGSAVDADTLCASVLSHAMPEDATRRPLGELIASDSRISYGVLVPGPDLDDGIPFVRVQDLAVKNAPARPAKRIAAQVEAHYARTRLAGGEVLVGVVGSIGKVGIAPPSWSGANIARAVCRIVPGPDVDRDYLAAVLQSRSCQQYFRETTRTLAQPTLNVAQLAATSIPVPALSEQRRIVAYLDDLQAKVDRLKALQAQTAAELDALLPAILDEAFKGEL